MIEVTDTAAAIARVRADESALPPDARLFEDPYATLFSGGAPGAAAVELFIAFPFFRESIRLRTRFIDDAVRAALADGIGQIVVPGAGFDCRALRLPEIASAGVPVFEVDFATQLDAKRAALAQAGVPLPAALHFVPADFTAADFEERLSRGLAAAGFRPDRRALFVWEGVVTYLVDADIARSLRWMAAAAAPGSRLVFNYNLSRLDPAGMRARVLAAGFRTLDDEPLADTFRRYLLGEPPAGGDLFRIAVATT